MNGKCCFFIGHREATEELLPALQAAIEKHITVYGVTEFIVGHYGNFDRISGRAVVAAKRTHPEITLTLLLPYHPAERPIKTPPGYDATFYPPGMEKTPRKVAIVRANRYMIAHSDYLIAYVRYAAGNARELLTYAQNKESKGCMIVTNLADW